MSHLAWRVGSVKWVHALWFGAHWGEEGGFGGISDFWGSKWIWGRDLGKGDEDLSCGVVYGFGV